jgi:hypothetical protein
MQNQSSMKVKMLKRSDIEFKPNRVDEGTVVLAEVSSNIQRRSEHISEHSRRNSWKQPQIPSLQDAINSL